MKRYTFILLPVMLIFTPGPDVVRSSWEVSSDIVPWLAPKIVSFTASPRLIHQSESALLAWETTGTPVVTLEWRDASEPFGSGGTENGLPPHGVKRVTPNRDTVYVLVIEKESGGIGAAASVTVLVREDGNDAR